jgi:SAM-dependent methyltransferase
MTDASQATPMTRTSDGACRICLAKQPNAELVVRERMFGMREEFRYQQCTACGSLQIAKIPADLARYYPPQYYAYNQESHSPKSLRRRIRRRLGVVRNRALVFGSAKVVTLLNHMPILGVANRVHPLAAFRLLSLSRDARIADVGGGSGQLLRGLRDVGFQNLTCVDPYYTQSGQSENVRFLRRSLIEVPERFDLIMYHHSLEHVPDLNAELSAVRDRLTETGHALVRLPLLPNDAFDRYREFWVQIDAPRHLHVPSRKGLRAAAQRNGLRVVAEADDSTSFQWWGSELYSRDIALSEVDALPPRDLFSRAHLTRFSRLADDCNRQGRGDQGWFILAPVRGANTVQGR